MAGESQTRRRALTVLHAEIDHRAAEIAAQHGAWPCCKGCDACCRRLAAVPFVSETEWNFLLEGYRALAQELQQAIGRRVEALTHAAPPLTCPFLGDFGECLVYAHRPIACRTYGFYVERGQGLYCGKILAMVKNGECDEVVWGNHSAVEARLSGEPVRDLLEWFSVTPGEPPHR